ncbi:hypothetical protein MBLNU457_1920t1 [Dothideomycetes sp. NU457]
MSAGKPDPSHTSGPFYSQYDALHHPRYPSLQHQPDHNVHQFDMSSLGHALPPTAPQSAFRQYSPYEDQSASRSSDLYPNQSQAVQPPHMQHMNATAQRAFMQQPQQQHIQHQQQQVPLHQLQSHARSQYPYNPYPASFPGQVAADFHGRGYNVLQSPAQPAPLFMPAIDPRFMLTHAVVPSAQLMPQTLSGPPQAAVRRPSETGPTPSYPRGPPRKPKQSGHALWVGNLPPGTSILDLKDHFSRNATNDIESLFLMSKTNCAFVNYKTELACQAAMNRFHDSRFYGVRLVCRLRKGSTASSQQTVQRVDSFPHLPDGVSNHNLADGVQETNRSTTRAPDDPATDGVDAATERPVSASTPGARIPERFFIVKSLTMQDLEASVRDGIWATQSHNENDLNKAFDSADAVYLVFSANKSGEYFGYARMTSQIDNNTVTVNPRAGSHTADPTDGPTANVTPATETAPRGRVIDDSARGTIFWEAYPSETQPATAETSEKAESIVDEENASQDWGKPFRIEWISTARVPFYRTRGLRNPWNANEVKIARDGTELEPSVGRKLVAMFHRPGGVAHPHDMPAQMLPPPVAVGATQSISNAGHGSSAPPFPTSMTDGVSTKQGMPMPRYEGQ